jgi:hypothetical protein
LARAADAASPTASIEQRVARLSRQTPRLNALGGGAYGIRLDLGGKQVDLRLEPHSMRSPECQAVVEGANGTRTVIELPPVTTYRGTVEGEAKGIVAASIEGSSVHARIVLDDGTDWYVEPMTSDGGPHAVYKSSDVTEEPGSCAIAGAGPSPSDFDPFQPTEPGQGPAVPGQSPSDPLRLDQPGLAGRFEPLDAGTAQSSGCVDAQIAFEADYQYFVANGSSTSATIAAIDAIMNAVELIYARDVKIGYSITTYLIDTADGKYPSSDPSTKLSQFQTWWNANQGSVPRATAHLMIGSSFNGLVGIGMIAVMCNKSQAYGISRPSGLIWNHQVQLTAHELGHNWAALHCDGQPDCYIMCSYTGGCANDPTRFSMSSIREIETYRNLSGTCLSSGSGTSTALNPTARDDKSTTTRAAAVTINVLANDFDPNCQSISVGSFPGSTPNGGTVSASGDNLVYTPSASFIGKDTFAYTVRDAGGASSTATVTVDVQDYLAPESPAPVGLVAGLQARYYYVPPLDGSLGSMPALTNPFRVETMPTLSFPSTDGVVGESGLKDKVAMQCTGTINVTRTDTYTFYLTSDDGAKLYIDGTLRVDNDGIHTVRERSASLSLSVGTHTVRVDYYDATGPSILRLEIQSASMSRGDIPASMWIGGVQVAYYGLDSQLLPPLVALPPEKVQVASQINYPFQWGAFAGSGRTLHVGAVFEGYITVPSDGVYFFDLTSEDGSKLYVAGRLVIDNDGVHNRVSQTGGIALRAGAHKIRTEYFLREGGDALTLQVWTATLSKQIVPASWLSRIPAVHVPLEYATIDAAIAAAATNSMVWVAAGTYTGASNKNLDLRNKSIIVYGAGGPGLNIIDCQNSGRAFRIVNHTSTAARIEGFTMRNAANTAGGPGGAMLFDNGTLQVKNCVISGSSNPGDGGAVGLMGNSNPVFTDCVISGNRAGGAGGAIQAQGGAHPQFIGCTVSGNSAGTFGGGAHAIDGGYVYLERTILWGNGAVTNGAQAWTGNSLGTVELTCSDVPIMGVGGLGTAIFGSNLLTVLPGFCASAPASSAPTSSGGYRLMSASPALPGASPCGQLIGARSQGCTGSLTAAEEAVVPAVTALDQNVPNPFNPETRISFSTSQYGQTTLRVYDATGRLVVTLVNEEMPAGRHQVAWGGRNGKNQPVASGVYYYQLKSGGNVETRSMVVLK